MDIIISLDNLFYCTMMLQYLSEVPEATYEYIENYVYKLANRF